TVAPRDHLVADPPARDRFANADPNPVKRAAEHPVSTFSVDVDTASYAWVRRSLREGRMPAPDAVRVEELVNYFAYDYPAAESAARPFSVSTALVEAPWAEGRLLLRVGLRGYEPPTPTRANYTFLIDTSGSMGAPDKLPLLLTSLRLLVDDLGPDDTVAIVTYAGSSAVALEPTAASEKGAILDALDGLAAGGGTAGAAGIETAYRLAEDRFDADAVNRVILATDGDFNIGAASPDAMETLIEAKRRSGVYLSVLGFGRGNPNDALMQSLAQAGNGQAAYIDTLAEARKALVEERRAMTPIASDVKVQVEFNPAAVEDYRLIGYETRALAREDFANDRIDAGEIGAGHRVTALYEITPKGGPARVEPLRYAAEAARPAAEAPEELAFVRLRWKAPGEATSEEIGAPVAPEPVAADAETRFAAAVAGFGDLLRRSPHLGDWSYDEALALAEGAKGDDPFGYRAEFLDLLRLARALDR
ncbi:MAG: von Willebrand factor type A domain-containing protein, partial [Pseudomonadota bacterium]